MSVHIDVRCLCVVSGWLQGLIDFLVSKHKVATLLREKLIFKIVPMMNPDGVFLGNSKVCRDSYLNISI